jgi:hypothetical protein
MGVTKKSFELINNIISNMKTENKKLIELGIQESYFNSDFRYLRDKISHLFSEYISIDLHDVAGVTKFDLSVVNINAFNCDIITNLGTSEHVEFEEGQYNCWYNIHNWLNEGGIMIHELPELGSWKNHCRYYVTDDFFKNLEKYGYRIIDLLKNRDSNGNLTWCVLKKEKNLDFMSYDDFFKFMKIDKNVTSNVIAVANNPKKLKI